MRFSFLTTAVLAAGAMALPTPQTDDDITLSWTENVDKDGLDAQSAINQHPSVSEISTITLRKRNDFPREVSSPSAGNLLPRLRSSLPPAEFLRSLTRAEVNEMERCVKKNPRSNAARNARASVDPRTLCSAKLREKIHAQERRGQPGLRSSLPLQQLMRSLTAGERQWLNVCLKNKPDQNCYVQMRQKIRAQELRSSVAGNLSSPPESPSNWNQFRYLGPVDNVEEGDFDNNRNPSDRMELRRNSGW